MSSATGNHSFVRDGVGYDEVYPSGHKDHDSPSEERNPSASSPSSRDKGLEREEPEDDLLQDPNDNKPPISHQYNPLWALMDLGK